MKEETNIFVTKPDMPPLEKYVELLKEIWESRLLSNNGKFNKELEKRLGNYLEVSNCSLMTNGTMALILGLRSLNLSGEVITTPFSFVATSHAIKWNGLDPVFCDIEDRTLNIDPEKIESLITPKTTAILPVHVFGNPCRVKEIQDIAEKHDLRILYDAAHAFGTKIGNDSILKYGDLSALSFHATKVFNTVEGGAIVTENSDLKDRVDQLRNFGFEDDNVNNSIGLNAKMNEFMSSYGLLELKQIDDEIKKRKNIAYQYHELLSNIDGLRLIEKDEHVINSNPYFPIILENDGSGKLREKLYEALKSNGIISKRYFYPLISNLNPYRNLPSADSKNLENANQISNNILCLPIYGQLEEKIVRVVADIVKKIVNE